jgi:hypothetical protein
VLSESTSRWDLHRDFHSLLHYRCGQMYDASISSSFRFTYHLHLLYQSLFRGWVIPWARSGLVGSTDRSIFACGRDFQHNDSASAEGRSRQISRFSHPIPSPFSMAVQNDEICHLGRRFDSSIDTACRVRFRTMNLDHYLCSGSDDDRRFVRSPVGLPASGNNPRCQPIGPSSE